MALELVPETADQRVARTGLSGWPQPLDLTKLASREPEPPRFIIRDWLPVGYATLLAGHGGIGKSGIALDMAVCIAIGRAFFGLQVDRRRVVYLSCEDREGVLHWRLTRICEHLGISMADMSGWLNTFDLVGHNTILWDGNDGDLPAFYELAERMKSADVLVVDGVSDTFGGNENSRSDVKAYINALLSLIPPDNGAVVLIGHVSKPAASAGSTSEGYSGSTGWHNGVRARWYLYPETSHGDDSDRPTRTGDLLLELQKSNLGPTDGLIRLHWDDGAGLFTGGLQLSESNFERKEREQDERAGILRALIQCADHVPAASTGNRTAYHVLSGMQEFPRTLGASKPEKRRFWSHILALRSMGAIKEESIRRANRHATAVLVASCKACVDAPNIEIGIQRVMTQGALRQCVECAWGVIGGWQRAQPHGAVNYSTPENKVGDMGVGL